MIYSLVFQGLLLSFFMTLNVSHRNIVHIGITLMLCFTAVVLIFTSHKLIAAMNPSTLNGIETRFQLDKHSFHLNETNDKPLLITGLFSTCKSTCPVNVSVLSKIKETHQNDLNYLFINLKPDEGSAELLNDFLSEFAPDMRLISPQDTQELGRLMKMLPENFSLSKTNIHHSGYIYLYHPKSKGLITYPKPNSQQIIDDLSILQLRGS